MAVNRYYSSNAGAMTLTASVGSGDTTLAVSSTTGLPTSYPYTVVVDVGTAQEEIVSVTNASGLNLTVTRAQDGTSAQSHATGATVRHMATARDFREPQEHIAASSAIHGLAGSVVGTTDTQTLTNKTLTSPTVNTPTVTGGTVNPTTLQKGSVNVPTISETAVLTNKDLSSATNTFPSSLATDTEVSTAVSNHAALTATHGVAGAIVGTSDSQTLTNKTISGSTNTLTSIPESAVTNLSTDLTSLGNRLTALETPTWSAIGSFSASVSSDATMVAQYHSDNGRVDLRGRVNSTATFSGGGVTVFTLPVGVRPNVERNFPVARTYSSANTSDCRLRIESTGVATLYTPAGETSWFALDGIYFFTS